MLKESVNLFTQLISLAEAQPKDSKERKLIWKIGDRCDLSRFLVPIQSALQICLPETTSSGSQLVGKAINDFSYFASDQMHIQSFNEVVDVASSKAKPKIVTLRTQCGKTLKFLCKQEKDGDLRKDARMMECRSVDELSSL